MSEKEIRKLLEDFCDEVDEGRVRTALHRLKIAKLVGGPLLALSVGLGGCSDNGTNAPVDVGSVNDYAGPFDMPIEQPLDVGPIADYMALFDDIPTEQPEDIGSVNDYAGPFDMPTEQPEDIGPVADYMAPFDMPVPPDADDDQNVG